MSLLDAITPYKFIIEAAVLGAAVLGTSLAIHSYLDGVRLDERTKVVAEYKVKLDEAKEAARIRTAELTKQRDDAIAQGVEREQTNRVLASAASASASSVRDTVATIRNGVPSASVEALRNSTSALATVFTDCVGRYQQLAEKADRHANDAKTLGAAFPVNK